MQTLINKVTTPPGEYRYVVRETGQRFRAVAWDDLVKQVRKHYRANKIEEPPDLEARMEDQLCDQLPPGQCDQHDPSKVYRSHQPLTLQHVITGTKTLAAWFLTGKKRVSREEVEARTRVCSGCHYNQPITGCSACSHGALHEVAKIVVGGETYPSDQFLHSCQLCGCSLPAKVRLPLETLQKHSSQEVLESLPAYCWLKPHAPEA